MEKKEKNKYDQVLQDFCGDNRTWNREPRPHEGYIYATDLYKVIRVEKSKCNLEYEPHKHQPTKYTEIFPQPECSLTLNVKDFVKEIAKIPFSEVVKFGEKECMCEDCNGSGWVEWFYEDKSGEEHYSDYSCPVCEGTGYLKSKLLYRSERNMAINGVWYNIGHIIIALEAIERLGHKTAKITHLKEEKSLRIDVEQGVEILVMSNKTKKPDIDITLKEAK